VSESSLNFDEIVSFVARTRDTLRLAMKTPGEINELWVSN
jgi:hypothetical protein